MQIMTTTATRNYMTILIAGVLLCAVRPHAVLAGCGDGEGVAAATIERLRFTAGEGEGYRMTYCVAVPLDVYWQFKTDFHNDFLTGNPHITAHRLIHRQGNVVLTENRYARSPERLFRWQTTVHASEHRLDFKLINSVEAGQKFHFGRIRLQEHGRSTMIYQEARFQFSGAALWAFYPWRGGMRSFLQSFVRWEQRMARTWQFHDEAPMRPPGPDQGRQRPIFAVNARYPDK